MAKTGFYREVDIPANLGDCDVVPATRRVTLPQHVAWSGQREFDLDDQDSRNRAYEILLAEGTARDIRAYVDLDLLLAAWDKIHVAPYVREQWGQWLRSRGLIS